MAPNFSPSTTSFKIKAEDMAALTSISFDWAESIDSKNWDQLHSILAPKLTADYTRVLGPSTLWTDIAAETFVEHMKKTVGNPRLGTQHLVGLIKWNVISETEILASLQLRAMHMLFETKDRTSIKAEGSGYAKILHHYSKVDGEWKLSGLQPHVYWTGPDLAKVFESM